MEGTTLYNEEKQIINPISHAQVINSNANVDYSTVEDNLTGLWSKKIDDAPNDGKSYVRQNSHWAEFSQTLSDVNSDNNKISYERIQNEWIPKSYELDGNLGLIKSASDYEQIPVVFGDCNQFLQAIDQKLDIYIVNYADNIDYKVRIPIFYRKRTDINSIELTWIIGFIITKISVDSSDGWGDILEFNQVDVSNISIPLVNETGDSKTSAMSQYGVTQAIKDVQSSQQNSVYTTSLDIRNLVGRSNIEQITEIANIMKAINNNQQVIYKDTPETEYRECLLITAINYGTISSQLTYYISAISTEGILYKCSTTYSSDIWGGGDSFGEWSTSKIDLTSFKESEILYYTESTDKTINSIQINTLDVSNYSSSDIDAKIIRCDIAPTSAYGGPSFVAYDGDYYYAEWKAFGPYKSSEEYISNGSGYYPKNNVIYGKYGDKELVRYVNNSFKKITYPSSTQTVNIVQETGSSTTSVMSQDAVTKAIKANSISTILTTIMSYPEETYSSHKSDILSEYDRILPYLKDYNHRVLSQISIDGPRSNITIGSNSSSNVQGVYTVELLFISGTGESNLDLISAIYPGISGIRIRNIYINKITRDVQVEDINQSANVEYIKS